MASSNVLKVVSALVLLAFVASDTAIAQQAMSCNTVEQSLMPCVPYVLNGGQVPSACCDGIKSLYEAAETTRDKQAVCGCLKQAVQSISFSGRVASLVAGLPAKCKVNIPYKISPSTDCKSVK